MTTKRLGKRRRGRPSAACTAWWLIDRRGPDLSPRGGRALRARAAQSRRLDDCHLLLPCDCNRVGVRERARGVSRGGRARARHRAYRTCLYVVRKTRCGAGTRHQRGLGRRGVDPGGSWWVIGDEEMAGRGVSHPVGRHGPDARRRLLHLGGQDEANRPRRRGRLPLSTRPRSPTHSAWSQSAARRSRSTKASSRSTASRWSKSSLATARYPRALGYPECQSTCRRAGCCARTRARGGIRSCATRRGHLPAADTSSRRATCSCSATTATTAATHASGGQCRSILVEGRAAFIWWSRDHRKTVHWDRIGRKID